MVIQLSRNAAAAALILSLLAISCSADEIKQEMGAAVAAVRPALIRIHVVSADYAQGRQIKMEGAGSGVIISPEGYAVTNHHVAADAERIVCTLADKREVDAKLVGTDPLADIAVLKLISPDGKSFPTAPFGDSSKLEVGDRVFSMGSPYALSQSVTMGIVSNTDMVMPEFVSPGAMELEGEDVGSIVKWIGHDALIRPGNSGGPLVNRDGQIVGINEISVGLSGAIPSNLVREVADQIIKQGKVTRSWLGVEVQPLLESSGLSKGVLVGGVLDGSPAHKAGLRSGDVILGLDGREVTARFKEEVPAFNQFVADIPVGKTVTARVLRDGREVSLSITTTAREKAMDKQHELKVLGITGTNITYLMQKEMQLASQDGVLVTSVLPSGPAGAAKPPLRENDVIVKLGAEPIKDVAGLKVSASRAVEGHDEPVPVVVHFDRQKEHYATVVKIGKKERSKPGAEVSKAWLGIGMQVLTRELAEGLGASGQRGVRVTQVYPNSPAAKAGLLVGDLLVKLDGEEIPAYEIGDEEVLPSMIRQYDIGAEVKLGILRAGKPTEIKVTLGTSPKPTRDYPKYENESFEFTARDIAFSDRVEGGVAETQTGAYVESVAEGGWSAVGGLKAGDVIVEAGGKQITSLEGLKAALKDIEKARPKTVVLKVQRGIHTLFLELEPVWPEPTPPDKGG